MYVWTIASPLTRTTRGGRVGERMIHHVREGVRFVMTGGGGAALYLSANAWNTRPRTAPVSVSVIRGAARRHSSFGD
jgi:hypothetical protein